MQHITQASINCIDQLQLLLLGRDDDEEACHTLQPPTCLILHIQHTNNTTLTIINQHVTTKGHTHTGVGFNLDRETALDKWI